MKIYRDNINTYEDKLQKLSRLLKRISILRLTIFIVLSTVLIILFTKKMLTPFFIVLYLSIGCFAIVLKHYNKIALLKKHTGFLKNINESEILREECSLEGFDPGDKFINHNHTYTSDLDIFGEHSIFQLLNRTTTESGTILLSEWLSEPAHNHEILKRQEAIKELSQKLEWRQDFQASGMHYQNKKSEYLNLLKWVEEPVVLFKKRHIYIAIAILLSILSVLGLVLSLVYLRYVYLVPFLSVMFVINRILKRIKPIADRIVETSQKNIDILKAYRSLIKKIEGERFKSNKLRTLQSYLIKSKSSAFKEINKLCKLLEYSQQRGINSIKVPIKGNPFYAFFNIFLLLDIYLIINTEKWKLKNISFLEPWSKAVSEFEVVNSLAGFSYSNPSFTFPEIVDKDNYVRFDSLGHPLIKSNSRVCNNFLSEGKGEIILVTGSNMGGKSTFLRSVGVNIVLALAGAPCCAEYGQLSSLKVFSSMRTQDNLQKGISSFYAELKRIEKMLHEIQSTNNVFFLLDEMFKGTNSEDRHKGGFSLINQIKQLNTSGIIATHDIELAKLSENKMLVKNYSFNSEIKDGTMYFSYELQAGICNDFNASELMRKSGIQIISDLSKTETIIRN